jgi:hypothetical protein
LEDVVLLVGRFSVSDSTRLNNSAPAARKE